ncbi:endonuclease domain-containing protein [Herbiconiux sp. L3-i23]|uniref:endonuclease domain-containing protein n=1 Tax=Herbiconiux sp. L3-i23 TaxID=2905871 RepID=UPI00205C08AD|nr:DUF559 domain-containing protein [Herbiconiux sp. L3-i23]BDI22686.1 hypothetical protein L3i23_14620 [Herbiconiux sp. L3-i23]
MTRRKPLPEELGLAAFTVAEGRTAGAAKNRLQRQDVDASVWGVRTASVVDDHIGRSALFLARLPGAIASHVTAAHILGLPLPPALATSPTVHLAVSYPERAPHARGLRGHSLLLGSDEIVWVDDLPTTAPLRTFFDLAAILPLPDLIAIGDHLYREGLTDRAAITARIQSNPGIRGLTKLRTASMLLTGRAESPQESRLRTVLMMAGLPEPTPNHEVIEAGAVVARVDLAYVRQRIAIEYQGDYHRERRQWKADQSRRLILERFGWTVVETTIDDITNPETVVRRLKDLLAGA